MISTIRHSWALLLGIYMLMIGNGLQSNVLSLRARAEGFEPTMMGFVMSAYFAGFLLSPRLTTTLIKRVGHVRVFAAFASLISAVFILFPLIPNIYIWMFGRFLLGISFAAVYVVAESWLNEASGNADRAKVLSVYVIVQMLGVISAGAMVRYAPETGYVMFVIMSILVSLSFAPILLSSEKAPYFESTAHMSLIELFRASPLGVTLLIVMGGVFALQFSMMGEYANAQGLNRSELSVIFIFVYIGGVVMQFPLGWAADRYDRRFVIIAICLIGALLLALGLSFEHSLYTFMALGFIMGGISNPLYGIGVAYVNDRVEYEQMPAAAAGLAIATGIGAVGMPIFAGFMMQALGADVFWVILIGLLTAIGFYGIYRTRVTEAVKSDESAIYAPVAPAMSPVMIEATQEYVADQMDEQLEENDENFQRYSPEDIVDFWLDDIGSENWNSKDPDIQNEIQERFSSWHRRLLLGQYEDWEETKEGALALILGLDQFSRHLYPDDARSFEGEERAKSVAMAAIEKGWDNEVDRDLQYFFYLPFAHSEILADQDFAVEKARQAKLKKNLVDFKTSREIIARFGRFPSRNVILSRENTEAEQDYLDAGGYRKLRREIAKIKEKP